MSLCRTHVSVCLSVRDSALCILTSRRRRHHHHRRRRGSLLESLLCSRSAISPSPRVSFFSLRVNSLPDPLFLRYYLPAITLPYPYLNRATKSEYYTPLPCVYDRCVLLSPSRSPLTCTSGADRCPVEAAGGEPTPVCALCDITSGLPAPQRFFPNPAEKNEPSTARIVLVVVRRLSEYVCIRYEFIRDRV